MITAFMSANELHAVYVIRREGMTKIRAAGFCTAKFEDEWSRAQGIDPEVRDHTAKG